jgi:FKBP-type peptidyl-prolyl cis-trans isomerase
LHKGDSATFIVSADSFFLRTSGLRKLPDFVDSGSMLYFNLRLDNVQTSEELQAAEMKRIAVLQEKEISDLQNYLEENNITEEPLANGMYFINKRKGKGRQAKAGDKVSVHYTGRFLDGKKFDSSRDRNKPIEFTLGQGMVIKGWDEGIARMKKGEMATLIIPSSIAYGPQGRPGIPPYSTLVFDVELVDIK